MGLINRFDLLYLYLSAFDNLIFLLADNVGANKAASNGTSFNTKRLDDDTENLAREHSLRSQLSLVDSSDVY
jgi:hypothetical protein